MKKALVTITNKLGLHARASAKLVEQSNQYPCDVLLVRDDLRVNGKSMMAIMTLAASKGTVVEVITNGEQEKEALNAIVSLIHDGFGESE